MTSVTPTTFDEMVVAMLSCEQSPGFSVYKHGLSVAEYFSDLIEESPSFKWKLPDWFKQHQQMIFGNLHSREIVHKYLLFHDCGKPYCRIVDENGKVHFPNHAEVSAQVWESVGGSTDVGRLIRNDMVFHTANAEEIINKFNEWSIQDSCTLLCAAFAEIHSNASMFGGQDSTSFKMKWKQLDRRGKLLCKHYFKE